MVATKKKCRRASAELFAASWNVRSLVEDAGDPRVCRRGAVASDCSVDRKIDLLVDELNKFRVDIAAIQETKWFGSDIWLVGHSTFLHSGRKLPESGESCRRNEGVGILLNGEMTELWKRGGQQWNAVSSRIVTARILLGAKGDRLTGGGGKRHSDFFMTVISVYAPTAKATPGVKRQFMTDLQDTVSAVSSKDVLLILGDFNARVGSRVSGAGGHSSRVDGIANEEFVWGNVLGPYGLGNCTQAGEDMLTFCAANELSIVNTWYKKKKKSRGTWTHPGTRRSHLIDYVVMRAEQRCYCRDVRVVRGAACWTDHFMVRARFGFDFYIPRRKTVHKRPFAVHLLRDLSVNLKFKSEMESVCNRAKSDDNGGEDDDVEGMWNRVKDNVTSVAAEVLGRDKRRQPDWFLDQKSTLEPLLVAKQNANQRMLSVDSVNNRRLFRAAQRDVSKAVRLAKNQWVEGVAKEAEKVRKDGCTRWKCIKRLQSVQLGRRPVTTCSVFDGDGKLAEDPEKVKICWQGHFNRVLNIESKYDEAVVDCMPSAETRSDMEIAPTFEEMLCAMRKLNLGTAAGCSEISPDLILYGGAALHRRIHELFVQVWESGSVIPEWRDAEIVPIPKKGDLRYCDNWRGISLLDVVGKLFARVLQDRLQVLAEEVLPDSQCGFRKGRGCVDMMFVARQLVEKSVEHDSELFVLFVDLKKAYDSVPRAALWRVLQRLGVPPHMVGLIRSLHEGMVARVRVDGALTENISVRNGLRQGCTLAPTLFSLYFAAVVSYWHSQSSVHGVKFQYRIGRKLVGDRTRKARLVHSTVTESQFADDAALYATTFADLEVMTNEFIVCASKWGLTVSVQKTKAMPVNSESMHQQCVPIWSGGSVEMVSEFTYLGGVISGDGVVDRDLTVRLAKASRVFGCLLKPIFQCSHLSISTKRTVYKAVVLPTLFYGAETWTVKAGHIRRMGVFHRSCIRAILGVSRSQQWEEHLSSELLAKWFGMPEDMTDLLRHHRLRWLGHVARMDDCRAPKRILFGELLSTRPRHGPKKRWRDVIARDMDTCSMSMNTWYTEAQDRATWQQVCADRPQPTTKAMDFACECGRVFRRSGDLKRHERFCSA